MRTIKYLRIIALAVTVASMLTGCLDGDYFSWG